MKKTQNHQEFNSQPSKLEPIREVHNSVSVVYAVSLSTDDALPSSKRISPVAARAFPGFFTPTLTQIAHWSANPPLVEVCPKHTVLANSKRIPLTKGIAFPRLRLPLQVSFLIWKQQSQLKDEFVLEVGFILVEDALIPWTKLVDLGTLLDLQSVEAIGCLHNDVLSVDAADIPRGYKTLLIETALFLCVSSINAGPFTPTNLEQVCQWLSLQRQSKDR